MTQVKNRKLFIIICAFLITMSGTMLGTSDAKAVPAAGTRILIGQKAPDFTLKTVKGDKITLSDYFGKKVIVLEFWATWCHVCLSEIPDLEKSYGRFKDRGLEILAVTVQSGSAENIREVVEKNGITYPVLIDKDLNVAVNLYKLVGVIPTTLVIGADGLVKYGHVGDYPPGEDEIPQIVEKLLKETPRQ